MNTEIVLKFFSLLGIEIVLGIDNAIFLAILVNKIPQEHRQRVRVFGVGLAVALRMLILWGVSWLLGMCQRYVSVFGHSVSYRNALLFFGGLIVIANWACELGRVDNSVHAHHSAPAFF